MKKNCKECGWKTIGKILIWSILGVGVVVALSYCAGLFNEDNNFKPEDPLPQEVSTEELTHSFVDITPDSSLDGMWIAPSDSEYDLIQIIPREYYPIEIFTQHIRIYQSRDEVTGKGINLTYDFQVPDKTFLMDFMLNNGKKMTVNYHYLNGTDDVVYNEIIDAIKRPWAYSMTLQLDVEASLGYQLEYQNLTDFALTYNFFKYQDNNYDCGAGWSYCGVAHTREAYRMFFDGMDIHTCRQELERYYPVDDGNKTLYFEKRIEYDMSKCKNITYNIIFCDVKEECG